jgi:hypothetical protein
MPDMTEKRPAPKPDDDTYSPEETARRRDATVRAMIAMKPQPRSTKQRTNQKLKDRTNNG